MNYIPLILAAILLVYTAYRRLTRISISEVQGPEPETFLLGLSMVCISLKELIFRRQYARTPSKSGWGGMVQVIVDG